MEEAHPHSQEERLQQEILSEAKKRASRLVARATADAAQARERWEKDSAQVRENTLARSRQEAERDARNLLQGVWMEERRLWLRKREECLQAFFQSVLEEAAGLPADDRDRRASLESLAREALLAMGDREMKAQVAEKDLALATPQWLSQLAGRPLSLQVEADPAVAGGIRLVALDGSRTYDNTYGARLGRLQEEFRREVAACDK